MERFSPPTASPTWRKPASGSFSGTTGNSTLLSLLLHCWTSLCRREEKLYVEGMEDEDMKKETQNLAYPPAFKLEVALFAKKHR